MWETLSSNPLGRLSMRKYLRFATALFVACFVYIFVTAPLAHAADAEFNGDTLTYSGQQYSGPYTANGSKPQDIPKDSKYYTSVSSADSTKGSLIYFAANVDPKKTTTAQLRTGDFDVQSGVFSNLSPPKSITVGIGAASETAPASSCNQGGVGWIICPLSHWIAEGVDYLYSILSNFFVFEPLTTSTPTNSIYTLWNYVRNIANVAFVIAFLIVIYSQLTNNTMSNYTIKKILPRIIVAAILVNTSYWICAIAIDISNILGIAIQDLLNNLRGGLGAANTVNIPTWGDVTAAVLGGAGLAIGGAGLLLATGGVVGGLVFLLLGALLPAIFAALVAVAILAARQALITVFVIIAPLAFVAYLLPNTEEWFTRWRKLFMTALIMFPAFSLIFGVAQLAGIIIIQNARDITVALLGLTVQVIPLFITPFLIKLSSGLLGTIAGIANDRSKGVFDRTKNWANSNRELHRQKGFASDPRRSAARFRPTDMARRLNDRTLKREGLTSEYKAMSAGRFTQTAAGRQVDDLRRNAALEKQSGDAANSRQWNDQVASGTTKYDAYRRALHHQSHVDEGVAKTFEENLTAGGEERLRETILNSDRLSNVAIKTNELNKRAEQAKAIVDDRGNVHWEELSLNDRQVYSRQLDRQSYAKQVKAAQDQWETILVEAGAGRTEDYQAKFGPITQGVSDAVRNIQAADETIAVQGIRKARGEYVVKSQLNQALKASDVLKAQAAGIDEQGATKVIAELTNEASSLYMENVKAVNSIFSNEGYTLEELKGVVFDGKLRGNEKATSMHRHAAIQQVLLDKGNNWAAQEIQDYMAAIGMVQQTDSSGNVIKDSEGNPVFTDNFGTVLSKEEVAARRDTQQITNDAAKKSGLKVDWVSGTDKGQAEVGMYVSPDPTRPMSELSIIRDIRTGKIDGDRVLGADVDVIARQIQTLRDPAVRAEIGEEAVGQYLKTIKDVLTDPQRGHLLDKRKRGGYHVIMSYLNANDTRPDAQKHSEYVDVSTNEQVKILPENNMLGKDYRFKPPTGPISLT